MLHFGFKIKPPYNSHTPDFARFAKTIYFLTVELAMGIDGRQLPSLPHFGFKGNYEIGGERFVTKWT